ncbi:hypothetical protein [Streptomyces milbemycinicus]|uniref:HTH hxlR-type domain-containing protein n=1 Tax=Streptomyces milbemycinicus TaxID=476552 RepID=A0ABW8LCG2_9ACTN
MAPPLVLYELTELGREIAEETRALCTWTEKRTATVYEARAAYDRRQDADQEGRGLLRDALRHEGGEEGQRVQLVAALRGRVGEAGRRTTHVGRRSEDQRIGGVEFAPVHR